MSLDNDSKDEIRNFLGKICNKYSGNAEQKHLNQMYNIGIMMAHKKFDKEKMTDKLDKIIKERSKDPIPEVQQSIKNSLLEALQKGIDDGLSPEYQRGYNDANEYTVTSDVLYKRGYIDGVLDSISKNGV